MNFQKVDIFACYRHFHFCVLELAGKKVNTLVFSNIDSANITYKMVKELEKADNIGPILLVMRKPVHVLQLGASVDEIVSMAAIAVIDAQKKEKHGM